MDTIVIPNIEGEFRRDRAVDEMPQSAAGRTIMTTEPKFIPEQAVSVKIDSSAAFSVRMIDCVGYIVPSALRLYRGRPAAYGDDPRYDEPIPSIWRLRSAQKGHQRALHHRACHHDGRFYQRYSPDDEYEEAEERVIGELKDIKKPFVVLLNCTYPNSSESQALAARLSKKYAYPSSLSTAWNWRTGRIHEFFPKSSMNFR